MKSEKLVTIMYCYTQNMGSLSENAKLRKAMMFKLCKRVSNGLHVVSTIRCKQELRSAPFSKQHSTAQNCAAICSYYNKRVFCV